MSKKKQLSTFRTFLALMANQNGHIRFGFGRNMIMAPDDGTGGAGGAGGGGTGDEDKNADGSYKASFVEKLLKEKNNHRDAKVKAEAELAELKAKGTPPAKKDDAAGGDGKGADDQTKELLRLKDEENKKLRDQLGKEKQIKTDAMKLGAIKNEFDKNGGNAKQWDLVNRLVDPSKVLIDEDTQVVYGAESEIKRVKELAPDFFGKKKTGVDDGDSSGNHQHDRDEAHGDVKKAVEGMRLRKDPKTGLNPLAAGFAAMGLKAGDKRDS